MNPPIRNPHGRGLLPLGGLAGLALLITLAAYALGQLGLANPAFAIIGFCFLAFFGLLWLGVWLAGAIQARRARAFLASDRPLLRWSYSAGEWQQLKETLWQEEKGDWKIQWGCLALLLALAGLLTGLMIGLDEGGLAIALDGVFGLILGGLAGAVIGALVAGGNWLGARQAYRRAEPGMVALAPNEIFASDDYFRGDGVNGYILEAALRPGRPATLEFQLVVPPRPRMPREEQWIIPVPNHLVEKVEEILPLLSTVEMPTGE
jgi:hypothetical protein